MKSRSRVDKLFHCISLIVLAVAVEGWQQSVTNGALQGSTLCMNNTVDLALKR